MASKKSCVKEAAVCRLTRKENRGGPVTAMRYLLVIGRGLLCLYPRAVPRQCPRSIRIDFAAT